MTGKRKHNITWRWIVALSATLLPVACVASLAWADRTASEHVAEGVTVGGVAIGGMTEEQAVRHVWSRLRGRTMRAVAVRTGGRTFTLSAESAGVRLRLPAAIRRAFARGRTDNLLERGFRTLTGGEISHDEPVTPSVDERRVRAFVAKIERAVEREPVSAQLDMDIRRVTVSKSRNGRRLDDPERLARRISRAFSRRGGSRELGAEVRVVKPDRSAATVRASIPTVVTVSRPERRVRLFVDGEVVKTYRVAIGDPKYPTPTGSFTVQTMQKNPAWNVPRSEWAGKLQGKVVPAGDPRNPLVARWIGFNGSVGFHGTKSVDSLGQAASHGCVRMSRADVIDLYRHVEIGTHVLVGA